MNNMSSKVVPVEISRQFRHLRRNFKHLQPLYIPRNRVFQESENDTKMEGEVLFKEFVADQLKREADLETPQEWKEHLEISTPEGYKNPIWAKAGRELRKYADDFMRNKEHDLIRQQAFTEAVLNASLKTFLKGAAVVSMTGMVGYVIYKAWHS